MGKLNAHDKIVLAKYILVRELPFFGHLAYYLSPKPVESITSYIDNVQIIRPIPRGATDGNNLYYNPSWIDSLTLEETTFFVTHEVMHCALEHLSEERRAYRPKKKWDRACDYAANDIIDQQHSKYLKAPANILFDNAFRGWAVERIFGTLADVDEDEYDVHVCCSGKDLDKLKNEWRIRIIQAYNYAKQVGHLPAGMEEYIKELVSPKIPWQETLRRYVDRLCRDDYSFMRPNRKTAYLNLYFPSFLTLGLGIIYFIVDTSGSISKKELVQFVSELNAILQTFHAEVHVVQCDAEVQSHEILEPMQEIDPESIVMRGRGGTRFSPPFELIEKEGMPPTAAIYMTDGGSNDFPEEHPSYPVLWISTTKAEYPFGEVIFLEP